MTNGGRLVPQAVLLRKRQTLNIHMVAGSDGGGRAVPGTTAAALATSGDSVKTLEIYMHLSPRLLRESVAVATIAFHYRYSLLGLEPPHTRPLKAKKETHLLSSPPSASKSSTSATDISTSSSAST